MSALFSKNVANGRSLNYIGFMSVSSRDLTLG